MIQLRLSYYILQKHIADRRAGDLFRYGQELPLNFSTGGVVMRSWLILALVSAVSLNAQWIQINGPALTINAFARSESTLLAASDGNGLHASTDGGLTWRSVNGIQPGQVLQNKRIVSLFVDGRRLYAGEYQNGLYYSTNDGATWTKYGAPVNNYGINAIVKIDSVLVAAGQYVFRSTNGGSTWVTAIAGLPIGSAQVNVMGANSSTVFAAMNDGTSGIYRSTDYGANWSPANSGINITNKYCVGISRSGETVYALFGNGALYKSTNNGAQWDSIGTRSSSNCIAVNADTIFVGLNNSNIDRSTDGGRSWTRLSGGAQNPKTIFFDGARILVGGTSAQFAGDGGVFLSTNNGGSWTRTTTLLLLGSVTSLVIVGEQLIASVTESGSGNTIRGVWSSTDQGFTWKKISTVSVPNVTYVTLSQMQVIGNRILAYGSGIGTYGVFVSSDTGKTWQQSNSGLPQNPSITQIVRYADSIFVLSGKLYRSTDSGASWVLWHGNLPASGSLAGLAVRRDTLYATRGSDYNIYRSADGGRTWETASTNLQTLNLSTPEKLYTDGKRIYAITGSRRLAWCENDGSIWMESSGIQFTVNRAAQELLFHFNNLFVMTQSEGVYVSTNYGQTWSQMNQGIAESFPSFRNGLIAWNHLYASQGGKVVRRQLSEFGVTSVHDVSASTIPSHLLLHQNYPNPFNPSTTISFALPTSAFTTLKVYDLLGREITTLVNDRLTAGAHQYVFDASTLPSGVYFYRLQAGVYGETKKMLLTK